MHNDWLIVANASYARIFDVKRAKAKPSELSLVKEIHHPASRMRKQDLVSDKPGIYKASRITGGGHSQDTNPKTVEMDRFAKELAQLIDHARTLNQFERLTITASPQFYGLLDKYLSGSIKDLLTRVVKKDYTGVVQRDLQRLLFNTSPTRVPEPYNS
ncbi:MAG: host attachment protein [Gammaproteobacteria bacterium]|nr:host attachment protein [Gammaproteobacteria bacterium]